MTTRPRYGRGRGSTIPLTRPTWARAVPVTDKENEPMTDTAAVTKLERGYCPACGLNVALRKGGLVREHTAHGAKCAGSGQPASLEPPTPQAQAAAQAEPVKGTGVAMSPARSKAYDVAVAAGATPAEAAAAAADVPLDSPAREKIKKQAAADGAVVDEHRKAMAEAKASTVDPPPELDAATGLPAKSGGRTAKNGGARPAHVPAADGPPPAGAPILQRLPLDLFDFSPDNVRTDLGTDEGLDELGASIAARGLVEPVVARRTGDGRVELIAGARRLEAARRNGTVDALDVIIRDVDGAAERIELMLIENAMRKDLEPLEEATAFARLVDEFGYTQGTLAGRLGRSQSHISKRLSLLKLTDYGRDALAGGSITVRDAEELAKQPAKIIDAALHEALGAAGAGDPAKAGRALGGAIRQAKADENRRRAQAASLKLLKAAGTLVVDLIGQAEAPPAGALELDEIDALTDGIPDDLSIDHFTNVLLERHAACPGHAAGITRTGDIRYLCTNVAELHPSEAVVAPDDPAVVAREQARKAADAFDAQVAAAVDARSAAMRDLLRRRPSAAATQHIMAAYLETQDVTGLVGAGRGILPEARRALALLDVEVGPGDNWADLLNVVVPDKGLSTVALALALAAGDRELLRYHGGDVAPATLRHLRFLNQEAGYTLAEFEADLEELDDSEPTELTDPADPELEEWEGPEPAGDTEAVRAAVAAVANADPGDVVDSD